ncbi:hypothetical protein DQ04_00651060 [Trypanosoma grayi]|uniref:hypothetical protein n=1 Tax=Trypanosoma grayi TaxID=71804 RepID=UPI0004F47E8C|nr:hypothetical protein DQ04_00651060 [Trypanosoma grayi]KEG14052.1 hypothetical protein DQ04_00651060 [Trypanosoma grayi]
MSEHESYEDDFEDVDERSVSSYKTDASLSSSNKDASPSHSSALPLKAVVNDSSSGASAIIGTTPGRARQLIGSPATRNIAPSLAANSEDLHLLHVSKITSVGQLQPEVPNNYCGADNPDVVRDPYDGTALPSNPRGILGLESHSPLSASSPPSSSSASSSSAAAASSSSSSSVSASASSSRKNSVGTQESEVVQKDLKETLTPKFTHSESPVASQNRIQKVDKLVLPMSKTKQRDGGNTVHVWKQKSGTVTPRTPRTTSSSRGDSPPLMKAVLPTPPHVKNRAVSMSFSLSPSRPRDAELQQKNTRPSLTEARSTDGGRTPRSGALIGVDGDNFATPCVRLHRKIAQAKSELEEVQRAIQELDQPSPTSQRSSKKEGMGRPLKSLEGLRRDNRHLHQLVGVRGEGKLNIGVLMTIANEELKHAMEELKDIKQRKRYLMSEDRRAAIMFAQIAKSQPPAGEERARQHKEGMYNRINLQSKLQRLQEKIEAIRDASSHLSERIRVLEERIQTEGLSDIKHEDYLALQATVKKNAKIIDRLTPSISVPSGTVERGRSADKHSGEEDLSSVPFPEKSKLESTVRKLLRQLEQKDEQISIYRSKLTVATAATQRVGAVSAPVAARGKSREGQHRLVDGSSKQKRPSPMSRKRSSEPRTAEERIVHRAGPLAPRRGEAGSKPGSRRESLTKGSHHQQKEQNGALPQHPTEPKRVIGQKKASASLHKLNESPVRTSSDRQSLGSLLRLSLPLGDNDTSESPSKVAIDRIKQRLAEGDISRRQADADSARGEQVVVEEESCRQASADRLRFSPSAPHEVASLPTADLSEDNDVVEEDAVLDNITSDVEGVTTSNDVQDEIDSVIEEVDSVEEEADSVTEEVNGLQDKIDGMPEERNTIQNKMSRVQKMNGVHGDFEGVHEELNGVQQGGNSGRSTPLWLLD